MCIQDLLLNEKGSLIPNDCHVAKQIVLVTIQIYWFRPENYVLLILIDNNFARNGCSTKYCYGSYINTGPQGPSKTHFHLVTFCDKHSNRGCDRGFIEKNHSQVSFSIIYQFRNRERDSQ